MSDRKINVPSYNSLIPRDRRIKSIMDLYEIVKEGDAEYYVKPETGIPASDLSQDVQDDLQAAITQSDWNQTDPNAVDFIKNKPSSTLQEQANWTQEDTMAPSYIRNKPTYATSSEVNEVVEQIII